MNTFSYTRYCDYTRFVDFKRLDFIIHTLEANYGAAKNKVMGLDIGCGKGNITLPLTSLGYKMLGVDIYARAIDICIQKKEKLFSGHQDYPKFLAGDAENLSFRQGDNFDFVICSEVLEHVRHPEKVLKSLDSCLKQNGILIVTVPNGFGPYSLVFDQLRNKIVHKLVPRIGPSEHVQYFTFSAITKLIKGAGFEVLKVKHSDFISFLPLLVKSDRFCVWDCKLADSLFHPMVSGWFLVYRKKGN